MSNPNNAFKSHQGVSSLRRKKRKKKTPKFSYKNELSNYGNIFSNNYPKKSGKNAKLTAPPIIRKNKRDLIKKSARFFKRPEKSSKSSYNELLHKHKASNGVKEDLIERNNKAFLKKEKSYGTGISINSSFSTAQNLGGFKECSVQENKEKPKRGILTVKVSKQNMFNKHSSKDFSVNKMNNKTIEISDHENLKEIFLAEQPKRMDYGTQKIIEGMSYDHRYKKGGSLNSSSKFSEKSGNINIQLQTNSKKRSSKKEDFKRTKIALRNSFESDKDTGFRVSPIVKISGAGTKISSGNTISFNNLSDAKFSSIKNSISKPFCKMKRSSRLVSENKGRTNSNVFKDDLDNDFERGHKISPIKSMKKKKNSSRKHSGGKILSKFKKLKI